MSSVHPSRYELILSFNLLQRFYFPANIIGIAVDNLAASLSEGGVLIVGNTDALSCASETKWRDGLPPPGGRFLTRAIFAIMRKERHISARSAAVQGPPQRCPV
jgi:hypothetical protein